MLTHCFNKNNRNLVTLGWNLYHKVGWRWSRWHLLGQELILWLSKWFIGSLMEFLFIKRYSSQILISATALHQLETEKYFF